MWFRIANLDRYLCLMLGLPQGCLDRSMVSEAVLANDTLLGRIERIHCVIASRILERNDSPPNSHDPTLTGTLDVELQKAARQFPSKWWLVPDRAPPLFEPSGPVLGYSAPVRAGAALQRTQPTSPAVHAAILIR